MSDRQRELQQLLTEGNRYLRRAHWALFVVIGLLVGHLEVLTLPYAMAQGGLKGLLIVAYPLFLGYLVIAVVRGKPAPPGRPPGQDDIRDDV